MSNLCTIHFANTRYPAMRLAAHEPLSHHLTLQNSPVLFGCRTGLCGTCLVKVTGEIPPPGLEEQEMLDALAPGAVNVRLACQIDLTADIAIALQNY